MNRRRTGPLILTVFFALLLQQPLYAAQDHDDHEASAQPKETVPHARNQIIKLTDAGLEPAKLTMRHEDSIVFLLNSSTDSLTTVELTFGKHTFHCATSNLRLDDDGVARSIRPFGPRDFALACFPERGTYSLKVYGLKKNPTGLSATITVE